MKRAELLLLFVTLAVVGPKPLETALGSPLPNTPEKSGSTKISVTLFGQPCMLRGQMDEAALKAIHAISPEKLAAPQTLEEAKRAIETLKKTQKVPAGLEMYRDRFTKHSQSIVTFNNALAALRKSGKIETFIANIKPHLFQGRRGQDFETFARKLAAKESGKSWSASTVTQLNDSFLESIEPYPEEEFHRAIQRMKVTYECEFGAAGENSDASDEDDSEDVEKQPEQAVH